MVKIKDLVTLVNLLLGFSALVMILEADYYRATLFILAAVAADGLDGSISRKFFKGDDFGKELDSLADVVSFGVAPALLVYNSIIGGILGLIVAVFLLSTGVIRLARFNIKSSQPGFFTGLPIPASAILIVTFYNTSLSLNSYLIAMFVFFLAFLNVSKFSYPSHKRQLTRAQITGITFIGLILILMANIGLLWEFAFGIGILYLLFPIYSKIL